MHNYRQLINVRAGIDYFLLITNHRCHQASLACSAESKYISCLICRPLYTGIVQSCLVSWLCLCLLSFGTANLSSYIYPCDCVVRACARFPLCFCRYICSQQCHRPFPCQLLFIKFASCIYILMVNVSLICLLFMPPLILSWMIGVIMLLSFSLVPNLTHLQFDMLSFDDHEKLIMSI